MRGDNPPPDWMTEEQRQSLKRPPLWKFYLQPPGLIEKFEGKTLVGYEPNPEAENTQYLPPNFYMEKIGGQTKSWIDANIMNRSSVQIDGKAVYPDFRRDAHVSDKPLEPVPTLPILVGLDFGRQPAAIGFRFVDEFEPVLKTRAATAVDGDPQHQRTSLRPRYGVDPPGRSRRQAEDGRVGTDQ
jgi:hypothetical protein